MRYLFICLFVLLFSTLHANVREVIELDKGWKFTKGDIEDAMNPNYDDRKWESVVVPHDWAIAGPFDREIDIQYVAIEQNGDITPSVHTGRTGALPYIGVGWYRLELDLPKDYAHTELQFDGAMAEPIIYVNGQEAGKWANGYNAFNVDITPFLVEGKNSIAVRLQNLEQSSRWYSGAGLYRPVHLVRTQPVAIDTWGITVTTPVVTSNNALVQVKAQLRQPSCTENTKIIHEILSIDSLALGISKQETPFSDGSSLCQMEILQPSLWSPETPNLYSLRTQVMKDGQICDEVYTRSGVGSIAVYAE